MECLNLFLLKTYYDIWTYLETGELIYIASGINVCVHEEMGVHAHGNMAMYTEKQGKTNNERCKCMVKYRIGATQNKTDNLRTLTAAWDPPPPSSDIKKLIIKLGLKIHIRTL